PICVLGIHWGNLNLQKSFIFELIWVVLYLGLSLIFGFFFFWLMLKNASNRFSRLISISSKPFISPITP
ncbi:hypothetical protein Q8G46_28095, partial [Klebsiella pneumoniae]|uniref:hypothetical protein n=1 Tax=Klebsiella pneumoniae TaxID=573 RepID=UPI003013BE46